MESYIEVGLDEEFLKHFGYEFRDNQYKKFDKYTTDYKPIFKDGVEVTSIAIPANYEYEGKKYKIILYPNFTETHRNAPKFMNCTQFLVQN